MAKTKDWSVVIFADGLGGVLAVRKRLADGAWGPWHLPGGKKNPGERTIGQTGYRELWEETGIDATHAALRVLASETRRIHKSVYNQHKKISFHHKYDLHFCTIALTGIGRDFLRSTDTHEEVRIIPFDEYRTMRTFMKAHRAFIRAHQLVPNT